MMALARTMWADTRAGASRATSARTVKHVSKLASKEVTVSRILHNAVISTAVLAEKRNTTSFT